MTFTLTSPLLDSAIAPTQCPMLIATLTTETGQILASKEMIAVVRFPPAVYLDGGLYLFLMLRSPSEAFYRQTNYYLFPPTPVEEEEFTGDFPGYLPYLA
ncbi:hypothetical protein [Nostoc sp.]|uniref:hypothetical protein n=1 Tax=Nostoc sp. TaxID=1180 RepID=UPI002FFAFBC9